MIKMPISEITDRYTICLLKQENTEEDLSEEISFYKKEIEQYEDISQYSDKLLFVNEQIWIFESEIRKGKDLPLKEIGKRAIEIRNWNKQRIFIKNEMVEKYKEGFKDIKINHLSQ